MENEALSILDKRTEKTYEIPIRQGNHPGHGFAEDQDRPRRFRA